MLLRVLALLALMVTSSACGWLLDAEADQTVGAMGMTSDLMTVLTLVNEARASERLCGDVAYQAVPPLSLDDRLVAAAQAHSLDMDRNGFMAHTGSDGSTLAERVEREGYAWRRLGENVARGFDDPAVVMAAWLDSPGHCINLMQPDVSDIGLGRAGSSWTQVFAAPR